jgi:gluconokinase
VVPVGEVRTIIVMGVSGSGKSTIALALATRLNLQFIEGDSLHSEENLEKMSRGQALSDGDRTPWLKVIGQQISDAQTKGGGCVVACSALKRSYRDVLRSYAPDTFFVMLDGTFALIQSRLEARPHQFMPLSLLASQFATLEPLEEDERGMSVDVTLSPGVIVDQITLGLRSVRERG